MMIEEIRELKPAIEKALGREIDNRERVRDSLNELILKATHQQTEVKELKFKKDIPTVIEYQGRRYVLDVKNTIKR